MPFFATVPTRVLLKYDCATLFSRVTKPGSTIITLSLVRSFGLINTWGMRIPSFRARSSICPIDLLLISPHLPHQSSRISGRLIVLGYLNDCAKRYNDSFLVPMCSVCNQNKTTRIQQSQCNRHTFNQQQRLHVVPGCTLVPSAPQSLFFSKEMKTEQPRS